MNNNYITITDKELADKMKKCKKCFREEQTKLKGENKYDRRKQSSWIDKNLLLVDGSKETHSCVSRIF